MVYRSLWLFVASGILAYGLRLYVTFQRRMKSVGGTAGFRGLLSTSHLFSYLMPWSIPWICVSRNRRWDKKYSEFQQYGDIFADVAIWPANQSVVFNVADPQVLKEITTQRARWSKPLELYEGLCFFGSNIIATENDDWKKHRKITAPAFSEPNNKLVWSETIRIMLDLFDNVWENKDEVVVDHMPEITLQIALLIIGSAGFGRQISWEDDLKIPPAHNMSFKDALHIVSTHGFIKVLVPSWAMGLHKKFRRTQQAFDELQLYMTEMVQARRALDYKSERHDLFTNLLDANVEETEKGAKLLDSELIGNIYIFLFAGHETTAHTMCFVFGLLALYQDQQDILYQHISSILPDGRVPKYEDMNALTHCLAVLYETLRLFPAVNGIPKVAAEDTSLVTLDGNGKKRTYAVPKGTQIVLNTVGLHYNPKYWENPDEFRPQRFNEDWPRDAFLPFSGGARSCLGRRFSETESIAILTMLIQRYKIEVKDEPKFAKETFEQRKERIFKSIPGATMTPVRMPLVFKRRH